MSGDEGVVNSIQTLELNFVKKEFFNKGERGRDRRF